METPEKRGEEEREMISQRYLNDLRAEKCEQN